MISLSIYVSVAIIYDFLIKNTIGQGKFPATITALLTAIVQAWFTCKNFTLLNKFFKLTLLRSNYSFWFLRFINYKDKTKSTLGIRTKLIFSHWLNLLVLSSVLIIGTIIEKNVGSQEYYFEKWFAIAGVLVIPAIRLFTTTVYIPNPTYRLFFRI
ncbi:hypothetical protein [Mycoplasma suis]|nr:hypothetical protein [Mycoplasma suis]